jgi:hypothetical protein
VKNIASQEIITQEIKKELGTDPNYIDLRIMMRTHQYKIFDGKFCECRLDAISKVRKMIFAVFPVSDVRKSQEEPLKKPPDRESSPDRGPTEDTPATPPADEQQRPPNSDDQVLDALAAEQTDRADIELLTVESSKMKIDAHAMAREPEEGTGDLE